MNDAAAGSAQATRIRPLGDRIVVQLKEEPSQDRLLVPRDGNRLSRGVVLAVGPGRLASDGTRIPPEVFVGDLVLFPRTAGEQIDDGPGTLLVLSESQLLAVVAR